MKYKVKLHYDYPTDIHQHMIDPPQVRKNDLDKNFAYYDTSKWYKFKRFIWFIIHNTLIRLFIFFRYKLHIYGKENLKKYKSILDKGFVSVCNHVFDLDFACLKTALLPRNGFVMVWHNNHLRKIGKMLHEYGTIPIPRDDFNASLKMFRDIKHLLNDGKWLHIYAEETMWYYYQGLREFRDGAFYIACQNDRPILPLAISFRPAKGIMKLWKKNEPCVNVSIGELLFPNKELEMDDRIADLRDRAHAQVEKQLWEYTPEEKE